MLRKKGKKKGEQTFFLFFFVMRHALAGIGLDKDIKSFVNFNVFVTHNILAVEKKNETVITIVFFYSLHLNPVYLGKVSTIIIAAH